jgi:benzodiazapine receptor
MSLRKTLMTRSALISALMFCLFLTMTLGRLELGSKITKTSVATWYQALHKPWFTPPDVVFNPIWAFLYVTMAVAAWLVWRRFESPLRREALIVFTLQLMLNLGWSALFFGLQRIDLALAELLILQALVIYTWVRFRAIDRRAGFLFLPYTLWVGFAVALNAGIWLLN